MDFLKWLFTMWSLACVLEMSSIWAQKCPAVTLPNGRVRIRSRGRMVNFRCKRGFTRVGMRFAVCLKTGQWSQNVPKCVGQGCPRLPPSSVLTVEKLYRGGMLKFACKAGLTRSGPEKITCDGRRWSDRPPKCLDGMSLGCDFEQQGNCGWSNDFDDDFDWSWNSGVTPTANTGPQVDHTTNTSKGHYLFMESSAPQKAGHKARLLSPPYEADEVVDICLEFFYHMFGKNQSGEVGDLDVFVKPKSLMSTLLTSTQRIFHKTGNQGDRWVRADVDIPQQTENFQLVFQATKLRGFASDIAIDDIRLYNCSERPETTTSPPEIPTTEALIQDVTTQEPSKMTKQMTKPTKPTTTTKTTPTTTTTKTTTKKTTTTTKPTTTTTTPTPTTTTTTPKPTTTTKKTATTTKPTTSTTTTTTTTTTKKTTTTTSSTSTKKAKRTTTSKPSTSGKRKKPTTLPRWNAKTRSPEKSRSTADEDNKMSTESLSTVNDVVVTTGLSPVEETSMADKDAKDNNNNDDKDENYSKKDDAKGSTVDDDKEDTTTKSNLNKVGQPDVNTSSLPYVNNESGSDSSNMTSVNANESKEDDLTKGNNPNAGEVKEDGGDVSGTNELLPLIIGVVAAVLVGAVVIAVLAWMWARNQRRKQEKDEEDQMNIITEYVETNLST